MQKMSVLTETKKYQCDLTPEEILSQRTHIPVARLRDDIRPITRQFQNFVLVGETGSGKTTLLPIILLELKKELDLQGKIAVTQPSRIAAHSSSKFVSQMFDSEVGEKVGYHVRFDDSTSKETEITYMTDGILLREAQYDPLLLKYSIVMVDEAHEQSTNIILVLGLLMEANKRRQEEGIDPIHIVVSSATIEVSRFAPGEENFIEIPGRMFPVEVFYEEEIPSNYDFTQAAADKVKYIIDNDLDGDILIFMPGKREIGSTARHISFAVNPNSVEIIPLHAEMSPEDQDRIFVPCEKRKVVIATNIAETSITPPGKINVIDTGLIKQTQFNPRSGIEQLVLVEHSLSGLEQRKGRGGRNDSGRYFALYTKESLKHRQQYQTSEILRSDLAQVVLTMKKVGIDNISEFNFLDLPDIEAIDQALHTLTTLGALDGDGYLTEIGEWLVEFALEPRLGRMVIEALRPDYDCVNEIITIASFLNGKNVYIKPEDRSLEFLADQAHAQFSKGCDSDFLVFLNIWNAYAAHGYNTDWAKNNYLNDQVLEEAKNVRLDLLDVLANHGIDIDPESIPSINKKGIEKSLTAGLIGNLLRNSGKQGFCKVDGTKSNIAIHPSSILSFDPPKKGSFIITSEIFINPQGKAFATNCLEAKKEWLKDYVPELFPKKQKPRPEHRKHKGKNGGKNHHHKSHSQQDISMEEYLQALQK
jgi:HrpA-like RNA helicase